MSDIVERLRKDAELSLDGCGFAELAELEREAAAEIERLRGLVGIESADLDLDWNRLRSGDRRALIADHQDVFDMVAAKTAEIERLRKGDLYEAGWDDCAKEKDDSLAKLTSAYAELDTLRHAACDQRDAYKAEIERLRDKLVEYMNEAQTKAAEIERLRGDEELRVRDLGDCLTALAKAEVEIEQLRGLLHECLSFALGAPIGWSSDLWERVTETLGHDVRKDPIR